LSPYFSMLVVVLCCLSTACVAQPNATEQLKVYKEIPSEILLKRWNEKGSGTVIGKQTLTVIKTPSGKGDVVILTWSQSSAQFEAEVYRERSRSKLLSEWKLMNSDKDKILTEQHGEFFLIQQMIEGLDGGQVSQFFKLPDQISSKP
jgi:hypothetical protein